MLKLYRGIKGFILKKTIFLLLILALSSAAQNFENATVKNIIIVGNKVTKKEVITRELLLNVGDTYNDSLRIVSTNRVENLLLFNHVEIVPVPNEEDVTLLINVTERFYFVPFPILNLEDRSWDKITYGAGMINKNFRGKNEEIVGNLFFGYRPGFNFKYFNPWIGKEARFTLSFYISRFNKPHRTLDIDQQFSDLFITLGRYWNRYFFTDLGLGYRRVKVKEVDKALMLSGKRRESTLRSRLIIGYDTRDRKPYASSGMYSSVAIAHNGFLSNGINYTQFATDLRTYSTINHITLATRFATILTQGNLPLYEKVYFGFNERIRGDFYTVYGPGKHMVTGSVELRFPLMKTRYFSLPKGPLLPASALKKLPFGINWALFYDTGLIWQEEAAFGLNNFVSGFGAGLHFKIPYAEIARLEVGFNKNLNAEIIFEVSRSL